MNVLDGPIIMVDGGRPGRNGKDGAPGISDVGGTTLEARLDGIERTTRSENIYWGGPLADDANDGLSAQTPVLSMLSMMDRCHTGVRNLVFVLGDVVMDRTYSLTTTMNIELRGGDHNPEIEIMDAINSTSRKAGFSCWGWSSVDIAELRIRFTGPRAQAAFLGYQGLMHSRLREVEISVDRAAGEDGRLFNASFGGAVAAYFQNCVYPTMVGLLFSGVGAGNDPNLQPDYRTNISEA